MPDEGKGFQTMFERAWYIDPREAHTVWLTQLSVILTQGIAAPQLN